MIVLTSSLITRPLRAQVNDATPPPIPSPQDVQPPTPSPLPSPELPPLPPPEDLLQPQRPTPTPEAPLPGRAPETISVERFEVVGSTVFSPEQLAKVLARFTKKPISFAELFQARSAVTKLYIDQGYITSGAYIPPQRLQSGVVKIQVVEGGLEDIQVSGTRRLNSNYVRSRIGIATKKPLNRNRLLESLQLLQLNPLIQNLSAELSAGSRPGASVLQVRVTEAKSDSIQVVLDNGRVPSVGSFRRRLQANELNFLGQGDSLSLAYTNTEGSNALDASYVFPFNPRNGTLSINYGTTSSDVIERPFNFLDIESASRYYELTLRQPVFQTPSTEFALGLVASRRETKASFEANDERVGFPSPGADQRGRTRISALQFFQDWTQRNSREVIAARSEFSLGIGAFNATINDDPPDSRFFAWRGQAQWVRLLAPDTLLLIRGDVQLADRALVPIEQFGLGGLESVRGYRQDLLLTDNGAFASAEVRLPILRVSQVDGVLQLAPFVDVGTTWNSSGRADPDRNTLASVGLGLRWQQGDRFTARLDWGIPLVDVDSTEERTWQENGVYFSVLYNPF
jgi:hemolysin activation/secretion protein